MSPEHPQGKEFKPLTAHVLLFPFLLLFSALAYLVRLRKRGHRAGTVAMHKVERLLELISVVLGWVFELD